MVQDYDEDGPYTRDCDMPAWEIPGGFECVRGHSHVDQQTRYEEGWDYAESLDEAERLAKNGVEPRTMDTGQIWPW